MQKPRKGRAVGTDSFYRGVLTSRRRPGRIPIAIITAWMCAIAAASALGQAQPSVIRIGLPAALTANGKPSNLLSSEITDRYLKEDLGPDGPRIEWIGIASAGPGINEAWASGAIDFAYYGDFPAIIGHAGGLQFKLIMPGTRGSDSFLIVPPDSTAKSINDLKGKRLAIHKGRPWNLAFARLLMANGLKESDFQLFNLNPIDGDAALATRSIDGLYSTDGYLLEQKKLGKIIWSTRDKPLDWKSTAELWVSDSFANQYPDITEKVTKAYVQTWYYVSLPGHRDEILHNSSSASSPYEVVVKQYQGIELKDRWVPIFDPFIREHYKQAIAYALQAGLIRAGFSADDLIESSFDAQALKDLKLEHYWTPVDGNGAPAPARLQALN
jgi:sulfonate transport system substrate-binding protein